MHLQSLGFVQWCECTRQESDRLPELLSTVPRVESFVKGPRDFPATPGLAVHLASQLGGSRSRCLAQGHLDTRTSNLSSDQQPSGDQPTRSAS